MIPGKSLILSCPRCGGEKEVVSLKSGNTLGGTFWSDQRLFAPMLPRVSTVQRCPHCGHYFFSYKQSCVKHSNSSTLKTGYVDYPHMKEAMNDFLVSNMDEADDFNLRLLMVQAYNDWFYRSNVDNGMPIEEEIMSFKDNIMKLIDTLPLRVKGRMYLKLDLLREAGLFDDAVKALPQKTVLNKNYHSFIDREVLAIKGHLTSPIIVWGEPQKLSLEMDYYDIHIGEEPCHEDPRKIHDLLERLLQESHGKMDK